MADPFEVRMRFTAQLQHLNASTTSATKAAAYALKHAEYSDDLHSCILEQLERNSMNNRANIMYFLPALCASARDKGTDGAGMVYVRMMERDILRIVDAVAPEDGSGAANVKVVRKVLAGLREKGFLHQRTVEELEEWIGGRDGVGAGVVSSPMKSEMAAPEQRHNSDAALPSVTRTTPQSTTRDQGLYNPVKLDKRQIEQRIEEDRERHKRAREGIWAVPQESAAGLREDAEFERLWEAGSEVEEEDYVLAAEEAEERRRGLEYEEV